MKRDVLVAFVRLLVCAAVMSPVGVFAEEKAESAAEQTEANDSPHSVTYRNLIAIRLNPLGLVDALSVDYQYRLYKSESPLFANNFLGVNIQPVLSPAYFRLGGGIVAQPLSILRLGATYEYINFFGNFDFLQSYPSPAANWSDSSIEEAGEAGLNYSASGKQLTLSALLQMKVGPIAARSNLKLMRFDMDLQGEDVVWYDPLLDYLLPANGWGYTNDADLLYITDFGLIAGLRYNVTSATYDDDAEDPNEATHRLGPLFSYTFSSTPGETVDSIGGFLLINWYLSHRFRTGEDVSQAIPYFAVGMTITGNLL